VRSERRFLVAKFSGRAASSGLAKALSCT